MAACPRDALRWRQALFALMVLYLAAVTFMYLYHYERLAAILPLLATDTHHTAYGAINTDGQLQETAAFRSYIREHLARPQSLPQVDIHLEHPTKGHTGESLGHGNGTEGSRSTTIAIGGGITSAKLKNVTVHNVTQKFQFFFSLLPSFCKTVTPGYSYHFYLAYDQKDQVFRNPNITEAFQQGFLNITSQRCPQDGRTSFGLHFVQCSHHKRPAWAQNDAMMEAYLDNMDYFYRINDDTVMMSKNWTAVFIQLLSEYSPSNVGVVGPRHFGGNMGILTYDFVHKTHIDIFGFYYPRYFTDWWADDWVTKVYRPDRSTKVSKIQVKHTMKMGQRYSTSWGKAKGVGKQIKGDQAILKRYLESKEASILSPDGTKVIAMSLYGNDPRYTFGAIRNAQITPVFFPGWTLRIYIASPSQNQNKSLTVPARIISKLQTLGADIVYVNTDTIKVLPRLWRYLVADDPTVDVFLVRNAERRLQDRDAKAVKLWLQSSQAFHCMRDHADHVSMSIVDGLWGAKTKPLRDLLGTSMHSLIHGNLSQTLKGHLNESLLQEGLRNRLKANQIDLLGDVIWSLVRQQALCHDSVSCDRWPSTHKFPVARSDNLEYLGEVFDQYQQSTDKKKEVLQLFDKCTG